MVPEEYNIWPNILEAWTGRLTAFALAFALASHIPTLVSSACPSVCFSAFSQSTQLLTAVSGFGQSLSQLPVDVVPPGRRAQPRQRPDGFICLSSCVPLVMSPGEGELVWVSAPSHPGRVAQIGWASLELLLLFQLTRSHPEFYCPLSGAGKRPPPA